jgi:hypothetical protein
MTTNDIMEIVFWILGALGGGGAIILGFSNYIGQLLAKKYEEKIKAQFQNEINEYQSQLDIIKQTSIRYSDKQFEHYSKLWSSLYDLKILADDLWQRAIPSRLEKFSKQLKITKTEIEKASLFIEDAHYEELLAILNNFADYQIGKSDLIDYRQGNAGDYQIAEMIQENGIKKQEYETLIKAVKVDLKKQIGGR